MIMEKITRMETVIQFTAQDLSEALQRYAKEMIMEGHSDAIKSGRHVSFLVFVDESDTSARLTVIS